MATIKEVAALAGVTPTTVTNVLRGKGRTGEATRQRVLEAVAKKGYRPNLNARALVERKAPTLALMLTCLTNPFYPEFTLQAHLAARKAGRFLLVCSTDHESDGGQQFLDEVAGSLSDGVMVANNGDIDLQKITALQASGIPVVLSVWENPHVSPGVAAVAFDSRGAGRMATEHLIGLGHRHIGAVVASPKNGIHGGRLDGYKDALKAADIPFNPDYVETCEDTYEDGAEAALRLLRVRKELTGLFVSNDLPALGVLNAAAVLGRTVPDYLSVASITNIQQTQQSRPALTTVAIPTRAMAEQGISLLLELIENKPDTPPMVFIPDLELIVRESTGPVRSGIAL